MANIVQMKDSANAVFYPQTHEKAVIDSNGVNLQTKLQSITTPTYVTAWDGASTPVVANIPAGVSVTYNTTTYTGTLAASASTANKTYLVSTGTTDNYNRYVTQLNGSTYSWQNLGSTEIDLSDYATKAELNQLDQKVHDNIPVYDGWMNSANGGYSTQSGTAFSVVRVKEGEFYAVTANATPCQFAFLNSFSGVPDSSFDINGSRMVITTVGQTQNGVVPTGAKYLYLLKKYNNNVMTPPTIIVGGYDILNVLDSGVMSMLPKWENTETKDITNLLTISGSRINPDSDAVDNISGAVLSSAFQVNAGDVITAAFGAPNFNVGLVALCDNSGANIKTVMRADSGAAFSIQSYYVKKDGYARISAGGTAPYKFYLEKGAVSGLISRIGLLVDEYGNNVWVSNPSANQDGLSRILYRKPRIDTYNAFRYVRIDGLPATTKASIDYIWTNNSGNFRLILKSYNLSTSAWERCFDSGNSPASTVNPLGNGKIWFKGTDSGVTVECLIDTALIYPYPGTEFNAGEPELVFAPHVFGVGENVKYTAQSLTPEQKEQARVNIGAADGATIFPAKMFPNAKLPCVSFQFDDIPDADDSVVALFDSLGVRCSFAFIASDENIASKGAKYLALNKRGYGICSHSVNGTVFNTTNYTRETAIAALQNSKNKLEKLGVTVNGFVSPSSTMAADFMDLVQATYGYAFTSNDGYSGRRDGNPCRQVRESMQAGSLEYCKGRIDNAIAWGYNVTFYGHADDFGNEYSGGEWNLEKLQELVEYAIAKRDAGQLFLGNTDDCMTYFYGTHPYNFHFSGEVGTITPREGFRYYLHDVTSATIAYNTIPADCEFFITTASGFTGLTFGSGYKFNAQPNIAASETWHLKVTQGCVIATKLS